MQKVQVAVSRERALLLHYDPRLAAPPSDQVIASRVLAIDDHLIRRGLPLDAVGSVEVGGFQDGFGLSCRVRLISGIEGGFNLVHHFPGLGLAQPGRKPAVVVQAERTGGIHRHPRHEQQAGVQMHCPHEPIQARPCLESQEWFPLVNLIWHRMQPSSPMALRFTISARMGHTGGTQEAHNRLPIAPLIADKRCYWEPIVCLLCGDGVAPAKAWRSVQKQDSPTGL
jgi:hypothetical protein